MQGAKAGRELITRIGRAATYVGHAPAAATNSRVVALIAGEDSPDLFTEHGLSHEQAQTPDDLFFVAEEHVLLWANFYPDGSADWHMTREDAEIAMKGGCIACIPAWVKERLVPVPPKADPVDDDDDMGGLEPASFPAGEVSVLPPNHKPAPKNLQPGRLVATILHLDPVRGGGK